MNANPKRKIVLEIIPFTSPLGTEQVGSKGRVRGTIAASRDCAPVPRRNVWSLR